MANFNCGSESSLNHPRFAASLPSRSYARGILVVENPIWADLHSTLLDFLDYYFQILGYINARKERRAKFDEDTASRNLASADYSREFKSYCGRERVLLRRRRAKLRVEQFHIIAQVGQGGYGEVYLARKQETGEVCALKKMRKRTLFKMDEVVLCPPSILMISP